MKKVYYIYLHITNNGVVFYVGKGTDEGNLIFERSKHTNRTNFWKNVAKKGYTIEIVEFFDNEKDAFNKEKELIKKYGRRDLGTGTLVNLTDGGEGMENPSPETRKKLSESQTGEKNHKYNRPTPQDVCEKISKKLTGRKLAKEVCLKMSVSRTGEKHPMYNKKHKDSSKQKMSLQKMGKMVGDKNPFFGKTHTEETSKKISESGKGRKWVNNGFTSITAKGDKLIELLENGWVLGRLLPQEQKDKFTKSRVGKSPWNFGLRNTGGGRPKGSKNKTKKYLEL
jgi:hypothetical protein